MTEGMSSIGIAHFISADNRIVVETAAGLHIQDAADYINSKLSGFNGMMKMAKRLIINIDESRCTGCGQCLVACAEGAIELEDGKARVISDSFCDGLGACLSVCPKGALSIEEREAEGFDARAAGLHLLKEQMISPCSAPVSLRPGQSQKLHQEEAREESIATNQLSGWPIQMRLVRPSAPYLKGASLLLAGDCTAFAYPAIQQDFIRGRVALVGCPKLDETRPFVDKLAAILKMNEIRDITILHMTVPCCAQLEGLAREAVKRSMKAVPLQSFVVGIDGRLVRE